jgi:hypothetical protein
MMGIQYVYVHLRGWNTACSTSGVKRIRKPALRECRPGQGRELGPEKVSQYAPEQGYVVLTTAILVGVICGVVGLAVDVGQMQYWKRRAQTAADAAAVAAHYELKSGVSGTMEAAAYRGAESNGLKIGEAGVQVMLNHPPTTGMFAGKTGYVEALVTKRVSTTLMQMLRLKDMTVSARAVATGKGDACIIALRPTNDGTFEIGGSSIFNNKCGIMVNSTAAKALKITGSACVTASSIGSAGGVEVTTKCAPNPYPQARVSPVADPYADRVAPSIGPCVAIKFKSSGNVTLYPGTYCGGIEIASGHVVTLSPGTYVINGGGLTVQGGATLQGNGVTLYNTQSSGYGYNPFLLNGTSKLNLTAPTSGPLESILFFTDRSITSTNWNKIAGTNDSRLEGGIYLPKVPLEVTGNGTINAYMVLVAWEIKVTGNATINNDYSSLSSGSPLGFQGVVPVE